MADINEIIEQAFHSRSRSIGRVADLRGRPSKAVIEALQSGEDFDTDWYGATKAPEAGRILKSGDSIVCSARVNNEFDEVGEGTVTLEVSPRMPSEKIVSLIENAMEEAVKAAEADQIKHPNVMVFQIGRDENVLADEYLLPVNKGLEMKRPPTSAFKSWGYQERPEGSADIPAPVKAMMSSYAKDPSTFFRDAKEDTSYGPKEFRVDKRIGKTVWHIRYSPTRE